MEFSALAVRQILPSAMTRFMQKFIRSVGICTILLSAVRHAAATPSAVWLDPKWGGMRIANDSAATLSFVGFGSDSGSIIHAMMPMPTSPLLPPSSTFDESGLPFDLVIHQVPPGQWFIPYTGSPLDLKFVYLDDAGFHVSGVIVQIPEPDCSTLAVFGCSPGVTWRRRR